MPGFPRPLSFGSRAALEGSEVCSSERAWIDGGRKVALTSADGSKHRAGVDEVDAEPRGREAGERRSPPGERGGELASLSPTVWTLLLERLRPGRLAAEVPRRGGDLRIAHSR